MQEWSKILNGFLTVAGRSVLEGSGSISALEAKLKAERESEVFRLKRMLITFLTSIREIKRLKGEK